AKACEALRLRETAKRAANSHVCGSRLPRQFRAAMPREHHPLDTRKKEKARSAVSRRRRVAVASIGYTCRHTDNALADTSSIVFRKNALPGNRLSTHRWPNGLAHARC